MDTKDKLDSVRAKSRAYERSRSVSLFLWLSGFFVIYPLMPNESLAKVALNLLFTGVIVLGLLTRCNFPRRWRIAYLSLGVVSAMSTWLPLHIVGANFLVHLLYAVYFAASIVLHFRILLSENEIEWDSLFGAACAYLLLGLFFASLYGVLMEWDPQSFSSNPEESDEYAGKMVYFSFITLTTLGYGDVLPTTQLARMLAAYEAVIGQLFVAGIIGVLVGTYVSTSQRRKSVE